jgi:hypothetical protein
MVRTVFILADFTKISFSEFSYSYNSAIVYVTEALVAASKEIDLEVNAEKTKYMVMSRDQNAGKITT